MSAIAIVFLVGGNLALIFVLLAAPIGVRTIRRRVLIRASRAGVWNAVWPLGANAGWSGEIVEASAGPAPDEARLTLSWEGRGGEPIERIVRLANVIEGERFSLRVAHDSALDDAFWRGFVEETRLAAVEGGVVVEVCQTDRYRGLAFLVFRLLRLRRQMARLKSWAETGRFRKNGILEHPLTQFGFAGISVLALWPLFGLNQRGFLFAATLTTVVAFHELGHMIAFRLMGHRRSRMIFIPILGGVAIGGRPYDSRFEVAFVSLMGAGMSAFLVPVAIIGSTLAMRNGYMTAGEILAVFAACAAFFNLSNLVPVWRFDGGQVLRQLLPGQGGLALAAFAVLSGFLLVGRTVGLAYPVLFAGGAVFAILSLITVGTGVKPRRELRPMTTRDRIVIGAGLAAVFSIHAMGVLWAARTLLNG